MKAFLGLLGRWTAAKFNLYTARGRALAAGCIAALASFAGSIVDIPLELQNKVIYDVADVIPIAYRGSFVAAMKALFSVMFFYAVHEAARSGAPGHHGAPPEDPRPS